MTACLYCIHAATTTDRRGNPSCEHCRDHVAPEMSDAIVADLHRENAIHAPMSREQAAHVADSLDAIMGHPMDAICNLLARTVRS